IFEAIGAGRVVVTNEIPAGTNELFTDKENILFYNKDNLEDVITYGLEHYKEMEKNVEMIRHQHCYRARMQQLLGVVSQNLKKN
ncbi:MAG: glycosyltransferase, partial [Candidatus Kariarchaeaceae archaeon]